MLKVVRSEGFEQVRHGLHLALTTPDYRADRRPRRSRYLFHATRRRRTVSETACSRLGPLPLERATRNTMPPAD